MFFFWRVLAYRQPIVDLRAFPNRNFAFGSFYTFVIGAGLYGATYLIPLFLAQVRGYSSLQIGETVVVTGLAQMLVSPLTSIWRASSICASCWRSAWRCSWSRSI